MGERKNYSEGSTQKLGDPEVFGCIWFLTKLCHAMCGGATLGGGRIGRHNHGENMTYKSYGCLTLIKNQTTMWQSVAALDVAWRLMARNQTLPPFPNPPPSTHPSFIVIFGSYLYIYLYGFVFSFLMGSFLAGSFS